MRKIVTTLAMFVAAMMLLLPVVSGISLYSVGTRDWQGGIVASWWVESDPGAFTVRNSPYYVEAVDIDAIMERTIFRDGLQFTYPGSDYYSVVAADEYPCMITGYFQENSPQWFHLSSLRGNIWGTGDPYQVRRQMPDAHWWVDGKAGYGNEFAEGWRKQAGIGDIPFKEDWQHVGEFTMDNLTVIANGGYEPPPQAYINSFYSKAPFGHMTFSATNSLEDARTFITMMGGWTAIACDDGTTSAMREYVNLIFARKCLTQGWSYVKAHWYAVTMAQMYGDYYDAYNIRLFFRSAGVFADHDAKNDAFMKQDGVLWDGDYSLWERNPIQMIYDRSTGGDHTNTNGIYVIVNGRVGEQPYLGDWNCYGTLTIMTMYHKPGMGWYSFPNCYANATYEVRNHQYNQTWNEAYWTGPGPNDIAISQHEQQSAIASDACVLYIHSDQIETYCDQGGGMIKVWLVWNDESPGSESYFFISRFEIVERF